MTSTTIVKAIAELDGIVSEVATEGYQIGGYFVNTNVGESHARTDRNLNSISFTGNSGGSMSATLTGKPIYFGLVNSMGYATPGEVITPAINYSGAWMHGYAYLDYGNDGGFAYTLNPDGTPAAGSDIVAYSTYQITTDTWKNSKGATTTNNPGWTPPTFTIPSGTTPGIYRMRYKVDWDAVDPGGNIAAGNRITANGGGIVDVLVNIHNANVNIATVNTNGRVTSATDVSLNGTTTPFKQALIIKLTANVGYKLSSLKIKHGYNLGGSEYLYGNRQWKEETIDLNNLVDGQYTIPAENVDGDLKITAQFGTGTSNINDVNADNLKIKTDKNQLSITPLKSTYVKINDISGRTYFTGKLESERTFNLSSGVYLVNKMKVIVP